MRKTLVLVTVLWILAVTTLHADGIILPPVAAPEVTMPDQRALLVWRDGVETLVIESRFVSAGERFAWVVPLPARPEIRPATSGTLPSLQAVFRPRIIAPASLGFLAPALFFCLPLLLLFCFEAARARIIYSRTIAIMLGLAALSGGAGLIENLAHSRGGGLLAVPVALLAALAWALWRHPMRLVAAWGVTVLTLLLAAVAIPAFSKVRASTGPLADGLSIEHQVIGDYDVAILSGSDATNIGQWLNQNGFALPAAAAPVLAEHAAAGGCFVATKLRRAALVAEKQAPHPLVFTFKTAQPVYPMKLTGTGIRTALDLDLFVFGDAVAHVENLPLRACGRVEIPVPGGATPRSRKGYWIPPEEDLIAISHTALRELCAGTTIATRLRGTLQPDQMKQDMQIQWRPFKGPRGLAKFTKSDALGYAVLLGLGSLLLGGGILFLCRRPQHPSTRARLWVFAAALGIGAASVLVFPTTAVEYSRTRYGHRSDVHALQASIEIAWDDTDPLTLSEQLIRERLTSDFAKPDSDLRRQFKTLPTYGDAPGQYHLRQLGDGTWQVVLVDFFGQEQALPR
jgi:hypothetical protein